MQSNLREVFLDFEQARALASIYSTYPTIRICRDLLLQYIFERPLIGPKDMDQDMWRRLGIDIFDQVMQIGIAIIAAKPGQTPAVVPWQVCRVSVTLDDNYHRVMKVYSNRMHDHLQSAATPMANVYVLDVFGFSPSLDGSLNALIRPLQYSIHLVRDQIDCTIAADRARARPPCFAEVRANDAVAPAQEVTYDYYADATSVQRNSMNTYMRNQSAVEQLEAQQEALRSQSAAPGEGLDGSTSRNVSNSVKNAIGSIVPMPIGQQVARGPDCHAPDSLVDRMRFIEQEVFVLLGVPRSFCMHDITVRHDAGMLHCTMTRTVHMWQRSIAEALVFVYNVCHNSPPPKKRKRVDVQKTAKERNVELRFELMPRVSVPELTLAYDKGLITWKAYQRQMATFCGMQDEDLAPHTDPWTKEERLAQLTNRGAGVSDVSGPSTEFKKSKDQGGI